MQARDAAAATSRACIKSWPVSAPQVLDTAETAALSGSLTLILRLAVSVMAVPWPDSRLDSDHDITFLCDSKSHLNCSFVKAQ